MSRLLAAIDELRALAADVERLAYTDELTGLPNRRRLNEELARSPAGSALLFVDLDTLKRVNDTHGHQAGDELLRWVARELEARLGPADVAARVGGDEFAVLLADPARGESLAADLARVLGDVASVGFASTLEEADGRMYAAKRAKRESTGASSALLLIRLRTSPK